MRNTGRLGLPPDSGRVDHIHRSFARQPYKDGITMQQQKFQAICEEHRRALIEKLESQVMEKAKDEIKQLM